MALLKYFSKNEMVFRNLLKRFRVLQKYKSQFQQFNCYLLVLLMANNFIVILMAETAITWKLKIPMLFMFETYVSFKHI